MKTQCKGMHFSVVDLKTSSWSVDHLGSFSVVAVSVWVSSYQSLGLENAGFSLESACLSLGLRYQGLGFYS